MKNLFGLLFIAVLFSLTSCGSDDDDCTIDSFVGTYTGEIDCDGDKTNGTLTITKLTETTINVSDTDGGSFDMDVVECKATYSENLLGLADVSLELTIDGDDLKYNNETVALGISVSCDGTLNRQ